MVDDELLPAAGEKECTQIKNFHFFGLKPLFFPKGPTPLLRCILTFLFRT